MVVWLCVKYLFYYRIGLNSRYLFPFWPSGEFDGKKCSMQLTEKKKNRGLRKWNNQTVCERPFMNSICESWFIFHSLMQTIIEQFQTMPHVSTKSYYLQIVIWKTSSIILHNPTDWEWLQLGKQIDKWRVYVTFHLQSLGTGFTITPRHGLANSINLWDWESHGTPRPGHENQTEHVFGGPITLLVQSRPVKYLSGFPNQNCGSSFLLS